MLSTTISLFNSIANQYQNMRDVKTVASMRLISNHIEDQVISAGLPVDFYAGFQRFSRFPNQLKRYTALGAACRRVYVFGVADATPPPIPGIEYIDIDPNSPLAQEWFLLIETPQFWTTLLTQEQTGRDRDGAERRYDGLWTYEAQVAERASLLISQAMGNSYQPVRERDYNSQVQHVAAIAGRMIGQADTLRHANFRRTSQVKMVNQTVETIDQFGATPAGLAQLAVQLNTTFGAQDAAIVTGAAGRFSVAAAEGDTLAVGRAMTEHDGAIGRALRGEPTMAQDLRRQREMLLPGAQSVAAAPIISGGTTLGLIAVGLPEAHGWDPSDLESLTALGKLLGRAMEQRPAPTHVSSAGSGEQSVRLEQVIAKLRWPIGRMSDLHARFEQSGPLNTAQREIMAEFNIIANSLNRAFGQAKPPVE